MYPKWHSQGEEERERGSRPAGTRAGGRGRAGLRDGRTNGGREGQTCLGFKEEEWEETLLAVGFEGMMKMS